MADNRQIIPIVKSELPKVQELKKNTTLKPVDKLEQLKQISDELDSKITPLLNADQQKKFQEIREEHRRKVVEKMGSQVVQKLEADATAMFDKRTLFKSGVLLVLVRLAAAA